MNLFKRPKITRVLLFGGLGNQLFQISAGFAAAGDDELILDTSIIDPIKNPNWFSSFQDLRIKKQISFDADLRLGYARLRMINLAIRMSSKNSENPRFESLRNAFFYFYALTLQVLVFKGQKVFISRGIGIRDGDLSKFRGTVLIGYFQTYELVFPASPNNVVEKVRMLLGISALRKSNSNEVLIQMRLGDYVKNSDIGMLDSSYFRRALSIAAADLNIQSAVVFSDDIEKALGYLGGNTELKLRNGESSANSAVATLVEMSKYTYFIISNSTFAWWAAALSIGAKNVIAPTPWFSGPDSPPKIIPPNWITVSRDG